jgi:hypothetical protein
VGHSEDKHLLNGEAIYLRASPDPMLSSIVIT